MADVTAKFVYLYLHTHSYYTKTDVIRDSITIDRFGMLFKENRTRNTLYKLLYKTWVESIEMYKRQCICGTTLVGQPC